MAPSGPVASTTWSPGAVTSGAVVSSTVTVKSSVVALPASSVAVHSTVVVPRAKVLPLTGAQERVTLSSTRSLVATTYETSAPSGPVASAVMFAGTVSEGAVVSTTVTSNDPDVVWPWLSVAVQSTGLVPRGNVAPEAGAHSMSTWSSAASVPVTSYSTDAPSALVASTIWSSGSWSSGATVSATVIANVFWLVLPASSVAEQLTVVGPNPKREALGGSHVARTDRRRGRWRSPRTPAGPHPDGRPRRSSRPGR